MEATREYYVEGIPDESIVVSPLEPDSMWMKPALWIIIFGFIMFLIFLILYLLKIGIQYSLWLMILGIIILVIGLIWWMLA